ncbi:amidohydrolase family protein [Euryhalocaulis caribicus]|uniref:amidohydrolase family protein n=1 Tax=Euryhalocaulis caribicus TaxID=1161401 RepID=UPI00039A54BA|nr:amidohydrolase family protein [Euryhalocaulis caribicus]
MKQVLLGAAAALISAGVAMAQTVAVTNARIVTNEDAGVIESGVIVIEDGAISAMGADAAVPEGAEVLDAEGQWVTPGVFAPFGHVGMVEIGATEGSNDISADESELNISLNALDSYNPKATSIPITRIEGVTHAAISPGTGRTLFGGVGAIVDLSGDFDSTVKENAFLYLQMGERGAGLAGGSRSASWAYLRAALKEAQRANRFFSKPTDEGLLNIHDAQALKTAVNGDMPFVIEVDRASDIMRVIALKEDHKKLDVIILSGAESWMVAEELAEAEIPVILDPMENLPFALESVGARLDAAKLLADAGVQFALTTGAGNDDTHQVRLLLQQAGNAVANGLSWDAAFAAITREPADIYGLGGRLGALATGQTANLVVWDGDPLEVTTSPTAVFIDGERLPLTSRQTVLRDRYMDIENRDEPFAYR